MGVGEQGNNLGNLKMRDSGAEVLAGPSGDPSEDKAVERGGMHNSVKDSKCFFLRFVRIKAQHPGERFKVPIPQGGEARRQSGQGVGS